MRRTGVLLALAAVLLGWEAAAAGPSVSTSTLNSNRSRLILDWASRKGKPVCEAWSSLDGAGKAVFIWNTHRLSLYDVYNCRDFKTGPNWWDDACQGYSYPALDRNDVQIPELASFSSGGTMLDHIASLHEIRGEHDSSKPCGNGDDNRTLMSMDATLWRALNWSGIGAMMGSGSRICAPGPYCSGYPTYRPSLVHQGGGVNDAAIRNSTDPAGPHAPFNGSRESFSGSPRAQFHFWAMRVDGDGGQCGTNLDPHLLSCESHSLDEYLAHCGSYTRAFCYKMISGGNSVGVGTFTRMGLNITDEYLLEMDQDYGISHDSNPLCSSMQGTYAASYGDPGWSWAPEGCGGGGGGGGGSNTLSPNQSLSPGQSVSSGDGRFHFTYQGDGNLVLYQDGAGALWASNTGGTSAGQTAMQGDGNLVVYTSGGQPVWSSGTAGNEGAYLSVQSDGNVVLYSSGGGVLWSTGTCCR